MASIVSLDNQLFWTQPRRKPRTRVGSTRSELIVSPAVHEQSTDESTRISNCESTEGTGNSNTNASGNMEAWQLDNAVRLPTMPLQQETLVDNVARSRASSCECGMGIDGFQQQAPTIVSGSEKTDDMEDLVPQLASPSPSSTSFVSQSTPITTPDENMLSAYRNNELYPIDPALIGPATDCASTCYPLIDLVNAPDASDAVSPESSLVSRDGLGVALDWYASDRPTNFSAASNLPWRVVRSKSDQSEILGCLEGAANTDQRLRKRVSLADKEVLHVASDGSGAEADEHRLAQGYGPNFTGGNYQLVDDSVEQPPPKRRKVERSSKDGKEFDESRSRCCSVESTIRVGPHTSTPALSIPRSHLEFMRNTQSTGPGDPEDLQ